MSANDRQVGGSHYARGGKNQHWDWAESNGLGYLESAATKYVSRWRQKNGLQDLEKSLHYVDKLIELHEDGKRFNRRYPSQRALDSTRAFAADNELGPTEAQICLALLEWESAMDLHAVRASIQRLIQSEAR